MQKISRTWSLMVDCWHVLRQDKELLMFPVISGACCLLLLASFAVPLVVTDAWRPPEAHAETARQVVYYGLLFLFYFLNYLIVVFFNAAIVACALIRMRGGNPTLGDGLRAAAARLPVIAGWALFSATVGLLLRGLENSSNKLVRIVAALLGVAWTLITFLVIPVLVVENKSPIAALKESAALLRQTWGEQLISNFGFGLMFALLSLPAAGLIVLAIAIGHPAALVACVALAVIYFLVLALVQTALQAIFQAALYLYARDGRVPEGFRRETLAEAMG